MSGMERTGLGLQRRIQKEARKRPPSLEKSKTPEEFIEALDLDFLNAALKKLQLKSGVPVESIVSVPEKSIDFGNTSGNSRAGGSFRYGAALKEGTSDHVRGTIEVNWERVTNFTRLIMVPRWQWILDMTIHEMTHYASAMRGSKREWDEYSRQKKAGVFNDASEGATLYRQSTGLSEDRNIKTEQGSVWRALGEALNEAVTEKIATELQQEYLESKGLHTRKAMNPMVKIKPPYLKERQMLESLIEAMSKALSDSRGKVTPKEVWQGIVRAYFSGEQNFDEFKETVSKILEEDGSKRLFGLKKEERQETAEEFLEARSTNGMFFGNSADLLALSLPSENYERYKDRIKKMKKGEFERIGATLGI